MFTGIVEDIGTVLALERRAQALRLRLATRLPLTSLCQGASVAVNGACLTVIARGRGWFAAELSRETVERTNLGQLKAGGKVNLERSLTPSKALGGHIVLGHIDGPGTLSAVRKDGDCRLYTFEAGPDQRRYLVEKGSVAVDGVSLTVFNLEANRFTCALIPHTLKHTTLGLKKPGDRVNIEADIVAKYVERLLQHGGEVSGGAEANGRRPGRQREAG